MFRVTAGMVSKSGLMILFLFLLFCSLTFAAPVEVTFFPNAAQVKEISKIRLQPATNNLKKAVFTLPGQADPDSLVTRIDPKSGAVIEDQTWRQVSSQDEEVIRNLKKKMDDLKEERIKLESSIKSLETQIQFWQMQTKAKFKTLMDATNMSVALGKNIKKAMMDKLAAEPELERLDKKIRQLQDELNAAGGKKETVWEVTVILSRALGNEMPLSYSYSLAGCGWTPLYRLEARPLGNQILFSWEGEIWQSSGQDWTQVVVNLANRQPKSVLIPRDIPDWIIKPRPVLAPAPVKAYKKAKSAQLAESRLSMEMDSNAEMASSAPALTSEGTYTSWALGKRFISAGTKQRVKVLEESWPAEFTYLSRPSQGEQVFVRALVKFADSREIPQGSAIYLIDGAIVGKRSFSVSSREEAVFFGTDPLLKAKSILISQKSGEKTIFQDKQTYVWDWRIDLENNRNYAIKMRIEEPVPLPRDERIKITLKHDPQPTEKVDAIHAWVIDVPALEKRKILTGVAIEAPRDLQLDLGWRR